MGASVEIYFDENNKFVWIANAFLEVLSQVIAYTSGDGFIL